MQAAANDPNAHTFSSSSVMHYSSSGAEGGQPKVYHATSSTRQAPGGVRPCNLISVVHLIFPQGKYINILQSVS